MGFIECKASKFTWGLIYSTVCDTCYGIRHNDICSLKKHQVMWSMWQGFHHINWRFEQFLSKGAGWENWPINTCGQGRVWQQQGRIEIKKEGRNERVNERRAMQKKICSNNILKRSLVLIGYKDGMKYCNSGFSIILSFHRYFQKQDKVKCLQ